MTALWIPISAALVMSIAAIATAWAQSRIGAAGAATLAEKPELTTTVIVMIAIPETIGVLGFVVAILIILRGG
jgi:V/A-type H+-transporting ATPase subunit K